MGKLLSTFKMFSFGYFVYVIVALGLVVGAFFACRNLKKDKQKLVSICLIIGAVFFVVLEYLGRILAGKFNIFYNLPIELFHIMTFSIIITYKSNNAAWARFLYFITIPVTIYSLIFMPELYFKGSGISLLIIGYVLNIVCVLTFSVLTIYWNNLYIEKKDLIGVNITYVMIISSLHLINVYLRFPGWGTVANYAGTMGESYDVIIGLLFKIIPIPFVCILPLLVFLIGIQVLMVIPFDILRKKKAKQQEYDELIALGNAKAQEEAMLKDGPVQSKIIIRSEKKASPKQPKTVKSENNDSFLKTNKQVQTNDESQE